MKNLILTILICLVISGDTQSQINGSFVFDGINRSWIVYLPENYNQGESLPLMLALHGLTQDGLEIMQFSDFNTIADTGNFVVAYPDGVDNSWNVGFAGGSTADDVGFLSALIDTLHQRYNIDLNRVYATGLSNGGFMSYRLACELGDRIAAIAPVAGTMTDGSYNSCTPQRQIPVLHIHGTADIVVNYNGGFGNKSVDQVLSFWNNYNNCPAIPLIEELPDLVAEGSTVERHTWAPCDESTEVMLLKVINGGHTWPGSVGVTGIGNTNRDIVASSEIWNFVKRFSLEVNTNVKVLKTGKLKIYPNPANGEFLVVESASRNFGSELMIFSAEGKKVLSQPVPEGSERVLTNISGLKPGLYLIKTNGPGNDIASGFIIQ
ncbi:MAG: T9SS type A sorting domain-containing protein [Bacteroidota bacterium]